MLMNLRKLLTPRWILTTLLVIAAVLVMVRLGLWQIDRMQDRQAFNQRVSAQYTAPELALNTGLRDGQVSAADLFEMEYRSVVVTGVYDPQNEIVVRNQVHENQPGYHLLTPLRINGTDQSVLVNRGFIPMDQAKPENRVQYIQGGEVTVHGMLKRPFIPRYFGVPDPTLAPGQSRLDAWNYVNIERIQQQVEDPLLPVIVLAKPGAAGPQAYPVPAQEAPDLSEGSHLGYAIQWFSFAAILAVGYPFFVRQQLQPRQSRRPARAQSAGSETASKKSAP